MKYQKHQNNTNHTTIIDGRLTSIINVDYTPIEMIIDADVYLLDTQR